MILQKGMEVLVNASMIGHPPVRPYLVTEIWDDTVFLEGLWDLTNNHPLHIPKIWLWPILNPGERVMVCQAPKSPLADNHLKNAGIWTVDRTAMYGQFISFNSRDELPCVVWMKEIGDAFDPRFLEEVELVEGTVFTPRVLKDSNTKLGATICAKCGGPLKIPVGLGPEYQHCPKCEP